VSAMESLIGLVNRIQRASTALGDYGGESSLPSLWDSLPSVVVVGGQVWRSFQHLILVLTYV
jgi:hypothetical protein